MEIYKNIIYRIEYIEKIYNDTEKTKHPTRTDSSVNSSLFYEFRSSVLSLLESLYGKGHTYYSEFKNLTHRSYYENLKAGMGILRAVKEEVKNGWYYEYKGLISAEIFSDFLEMANYLLENEYKDASAVIIGSVLEEHLRQLCLNNNIDTTFKNNNNNILNKKADRLNADLVNANIYNILEQKSVTAWLDLRNKAAHGKYNEYTLEQVKIMYLGVLDFINRNKL